MGLDISSASDKDYHYSYSGIHYIRWMAYKSIGGTLDYADWHADQRIEGKEWMKGFEKFPNLYWHSDCDGNYTLDGKVEPFDEPGGLQTGNSRELLAELEFVKDNLPVKRDSDDRDCYVFYMLYDLVKDVVENHDGVLEFC